MRFLVALLGASLFLGAGSSQDRPMTRQSFSAADAARFVTKWAGVVARGDVPALASRKSVQTTVTEAEINAYLRFRARGAVPDGIVDPYVFALGNGRLAGEATVDLDAVRLSRERSIFDVAQLMRGKVPVTATGVLRSQGGTFRFEIESATAAGFTLPKPLIQELVSYYTRTSAHPAGVDIDAPFALPAGIRQIAVQLRKAVITQ